MHRLKQTFILFCFILFFFEGLSFSDTLKITTWNIQMTPRVFAPFTKHARKKQKVRIPKIIQYLNSTNFDILGIFGKIELAQIEGTWRLAQIPCN